MTVNEFVDMMDILQAAYPRMEQFGNDNVKTVWLKAFEALDGDKVIKAAWACVKKYEFMPSIAQVIKEYDEIAAAEKHELGEIRRYYEQARAFYPGCGEVGYGWKEFSKRAKTKEDAEKLQNLIIGYVHRAETEGDVIDFAECVKTVRNDKGIITVEKAVNSPVDE